MASVVSFMCGFETQSLYEATAVTGSPTIVAGRSGQALRCNPTLATSFVTFTPRTAAGGTRALFRTVRFYMLVTTRPLTGSPSIIATGGISGANVLALRLNADGTLSLMSGATVRATSTLLIGTGASWRRIEFECGISGSTGMRALVDGVEYVTDSTDTSVQNHTTASIGAQTSTTCDLSFDDVVWYVSPLPAVLTDYNLALLKPTADSAVGNWKRNDGSTATSLFSAVDNTPPTGTAVTATLAANYIQNATAGSSVQADQVDLTCPAYSSITGLTAGSQVAAVMAICNDAQQVTTGSPKSGALTVRPGGSNDIVINTGSSAAPKVGKATVDAEERGQTFVATASISGVSLVLAYAGTQPTDFVVEIWSWDAVNSVPLAAISSTVSIVAPATTPSTVTVALPMTLTVGTKYVLVLRRTGALSDTDYLIWYYTSSNTYSSGESLSVSSGSGGVWNPGGSSFDLSCTIWSSQPASDITFDYGLPQGTAGSTTAAAQGAYPAGWGTHAGAVVETPTVDASVSPVVTVKRTGTYTRTISVDLMGVYVMWTALAVTHSPPFDCRDRRVRRNSLLRR